MTLAGLLVLFSGGLLEYCAVTGRSPLAIIQAMVTGGAYPPRDSWHSLAIDGDGIGSLTPFNPDPSTGQSSDHGGEATGSPNGGDLPPARRAVVAFAKAEEGVPYRFDTATPGISFDCSGLTMAAYSVAGVNLPHHAASQAKYGTQVTEAQALPGDLVFLGNPVHHVGIYVGNGKVIAAPHTGSYVQEQDVWSGVIQFRSILPRN